MFEYLKISVIVPCYNMEDYIEDTLDSIINQKYPNLELIIVDGMSTDQTLKKIDKYKKRISVLVSERDAGQYYAVTKGFSFATGDILCWLNADDIYFPWTLKAVNKVFLENNSACWIRGISSFIDNNGSLIKINSKLSGAPKKYVQNGWFRSGLYGFLQQENMFWRKRVWEQAGGLDHRYNLAADFDLWTRFAESFELITLNLPLASFRKRGDSRSVKLKKDYIAEVNQICKHKQELFYLFRKFSEISLTTNHILRLLTWKKSPVIFYKMRREEWQLSYRLLSLSSYSVSDLLLEKQ